MTFLLIIGLGVVGLFVMRRRRRSTLAGLNVSTPTYSIAPPARWSTTGKQHRL